MMKNGAKIHNASRLSLIINLLKLIRDNSLKEKYKGTFANQHKVCSKDV